MGSSAEPLELDSIVDGFYDAYAAHHAKRYVDLTKWMTATTAVLATSFCYFVVRIVHKRSYKLIKQYRMLLVAQLATAMLLSLSVPTSALYIVYPFRMVLLPGRGGYVILRLFVVLSLLALTAFLCGFLVFRNFLICSQITVPQTLGVKFICVIVTVFLISIQALLCVSAIDWDQTRIVNQAKFDDARLADLVEENDVYFIEVRVATRILCIEMCLMCVASWTLVPFVTWKTWKRLERHRSLMSAGLRGHRKLILRIEVVYYFLCITTIHLPYLASAFFFYLDVISVSEYPLTLIIWTPPQLFGPFLGIAYLGLVVPYRKAALRIVVKAIKNLTDGPRFFEKRNRISNARVVPIRR